MDPALNPLFFRLDWALAGEALGALLFLAFAIERALSVVFESPFYDRLQGYGLKAIIASLIALAICWRLHFDLFAVVFHEERATTLGMIVTALVVAGGSKGVMAFMRQVLRIPNYKDRLEGDSATHLSRDFRKQVAKGAKS
jgi:hypothetical protein